MPAELVRLLGRQCLSRRIPDRSEIETRGKHLDQPGATSHRDDPPPHRLGGKLGAAVGSDPCRCRTGQTGRSAHG